MICGRAANQLGAFGLIALCACVRVADEVVDVGPDPDSATSGDSGPGVETEPPAETPDLLDTPSDTPALDTDATSPETGATSGDSAQDTSSGLGPAEPLGPPPFVDLGARSPDLVGLVPCVASVASGGGPCLTHGLFVDLDRDGADEVVLRNMAAVTQVIKKADIKTRHQEEAVSSMTPGLVQSLPPEALAGLVKYFQDLK